MYFVTDSNLIEKLFNIMKKSWMCQRKFQEGKLVSDDCSESHSNAGVSNGSSASEDYFNAGLTHLLMQCDNKAIQFK